MAGRAGRRTRVYDCSYNMGEQYYKSALDNLDKKNSPKRESVDTLTSRPKYNVDDLLEEDLNTARRRAERAITDDAFFDSRGTRIAKSSLANSTAQSAHETDIDEEVQASLNRIRANKKMTTAFSKDLDFEDTINTVKRRARIDLGEKLLDSAGDGEAGESIRRRALKMVTHASDDYVDPKSLNKWSSSLANSAEDSRAAAAATLRAKATKERLNDLESEMFERAEKQQAREKRSAHFKKFLLESEISTSSQSGRAEKRVNF